MTAVESTTPFVGRTAELDLLRAELALVRAGTPRTVVIEGDAGIGKTMLIERLLAAEAASQAESGLTVLRATGEPLEAFVDYGVVDQLMRMAGVSVARLHVGRERSVPADEPVGVGAWLLDTVTALARSAPVAVVVDDVHWADMDSLRALLFAARRLVGERVLVLLGQRAEDAPRLPDGLRRLAAGRTGRTMALSALPADDILRLATELGVRGFSGRAAQRLHDHTGGNALYVTSMLTELPERRWRASDLALPPPRAFAAQVHRRLDACGPATRNVVEAVAVLGMTAPVRAVSVLAELPDASAVLAALDEAATGGLLQVRDGLGIREVGFPHPLVQAAVYEQLGPRRRVELHRAAALVVEDEGALLRHRVLAATPPDPGLAGELDDYARREAAIGAWAGAVWALVEASHLSADRRQREERLLRAVDASVGAGDLLAAEAFARDVASFDPGPWRDAALGYLAVLRGRPGEAEQLLRSAWRRSEAGCDTSVAAVVAQRLALHGVGRLRGDEVVEWSRRAVALAATSDEPVRIEAEALLGLGLGWQGRLAEGVAAYDAVLGRVSAADDGPQLDRVRMAHGWLRLVGDDVVGARGSLARTAPAALAAGSVRIAVWSFVWLAQAGFAVGAWDESAREAERAISLLDESGHEWLRPLARYVAAQVYAARGEWTAAEEHAAAASSQSGDYELMVVAAALARAQVAVARADHDAVLRALEPVVGVASPGVDEPGFWPWQDAYADALVSAGRLDEADAFLVPHERRAAARVRRSMVARLARVRGRLEAARGRGAAAEAAFARALAEIEQLPMPFQRAQVELAHGQVLRRGGQRRAAAARLQAARDRFAELRAAPYLERCERELRACGLAPAKRLDFDPGQLTAQERAVARLVAGGMSNRQVAAELFLSVKTVQFHLTHVYTKLGVGSRSELAARYRESVI